MRLLSFGLLGLALAIAPCHRAVAQEWPNRPVTMVVPFPAGAAVDTLARAVAHALSEDFGKQFIVENRAGAGGNLGATAVAKAAADGHTWLFGTPAPIALNKFMYKGLAYDSERDFMPTYLPLVAGGKVRALAVTTSQRVAQLPDVPTVQEAGFGGFEATAWYAIVAPTGTPPDIVSKVNKAVNAFLKSDKGKTVLEQNSLQGVGGSPEDLKAFIDSERAKWRPVIEAAKITM